MHIAQFNCYVIKKEIKMTEVVYLYQLKRIAILWPGDLHLFAEFMLRSYAAKDLIDNKKNKALAIKSRPTLRLLASHYSTLLNMSHIEIERKVLKDGFGIGSTVEFDPKVDPTKNETEFEKIKAHKFRNNVKIKVKRIRKGYSLYCESDGRPIARLRPTDAPNEYEVLWWSHRERWESIGDFGGEFYNIDDAIKYIENDPLNCFW